MGTSNPFRGGRNDNPLIPSWIPSDAPAAPEPDGDGSPQPADGEPGDDDAKPSEPNKKPTTPQSQPARRYTAPRGNFTRYVKSGGEDRRALGRAVSSYVRRTGGGTATTSHRMAAERAAGARLVSVLSRASEAPGGIREVVRTLNFGDLATRPIEDIYATLVDHICPPDGDLDDAHARDAYLEAVNEVMANAPGDMEIPSIETIKNIFGKFIANAVNQRILIAIGAGIVSLPSDPDQIRAIENGLKDFIRGCAAEAMQEFEGDFEGADLQPEVDSIFERAIEIIDDRAEDAATESSE